jgi:hypothetical protein
MTHRRILFLFVVFCSLCLLSAPAFALKKKKKRKKGEVEAPPVGRVVIGDWTCYGPPDFAKMNNSTRRSARSSALDYLTELVNGQLQKGFLLEGDPLLLFETAFLGRPQLLDTWLAANFAQCKLAAAGKLSSADYSYWMGSQARELEEGECYKPLTYELHDYIDILTGWQLRLHMCKGDSILIETTDKENGQFTLEDTGKPKKNTYITAAGDPDRPEAGETGVVTDMPAGALVMRFEAEDESMTKYILVGMGVKFTADQHGYISFSINDTTYFDNAFRNVKGAKDYLSLDIYPPVDDKAP